MVVTPNVMPSTASTSSAEATKILAVRPNAGLVAFASGIGGVVLPVFVAVRLPFVAARVERNLEIAVGPRGHFPDPFGRHPLVPHVQAVGSRRHVRDRETPVLARLGVEPVRHDE